MKRVIKLTESDLRNIVVETLKKCINEGFVRQNFSVEDFNTDSVPIELIQYVLDNVRDFGRRYSIALNRIGHNRVPLRVADNSLYNDIYDAIDDWCLDEFEAHPDDYDIEEIFG